MVRFDRVLPACCVCLVLVARVSAQSRAAPETLSDEPAATTTPEILPDDQPASATPESNGKPPVRFEAQLAALLALPWKSENGSATTGFAFTYGVGWGAIPVLLGVDLMSADSLGTSSARIDVLMAGQSTLATQTWRARSLYFDAWLRVQPPRWSIRPYVEGFAGTKLYQARYSLAVGTQGSEALNDRDWAGSWGLGAGVDFLGLLNAAGTLTLTFGARWLNGASAHLNRQTSIDGQVVLVERRVPTDALLFMVGVSTRFDMSAPAEYDPF